MGLSGRGVITALMAFVRAMDTPYGFAAWINSEIQSSD